MNNLFKKYFLLVLLAFIATILVIVKVLLSGQTQTPIVIPSPIPSPLTWNGITPGQTTPSQLKTIPGVEESTNESGQTKITIPRSDQGLPHEITMQNNVVGLIKDRVLSGNLNNFIQKFGQPDGEYWGDHQEVGFKTYVFVKHGVAVIASKQDTSVFEVWYFQPTTLSNFLSTWGKGLTTEPVRNNGY